jgi:transposase-like protein
VTRRRYSDEERAAALAALAANRGGIARTARQTGVGRSALSRWASGRRHPEARQMALPKKKDLADAFERAAWKLLGVSKDKADRLNAKDAMIAAATAVDKMRLLRDETTAISESRRDDRLKDFADHYQTSRDEPGTLGADGAGQPADPAHADGAADQVLGA